MVSECPLASWFVSTYLLIMYYGRLVPTATTRSHLSNTTEKFSVVSVNKWFHVAITSIEKIGRDKS
jgi:hypothetical protein